MMDDTELLRRYAEDHSEPAFTELVRRHLDLVYSAACRQTSDTHRAHDVAQTVFADLARKASSLSRHTAIVGWLYTSTHFAAAKARRTEQRRHARELEAHAMQEILASSERPVDWDRVRPILDAAMHELNRRDREAVLLRFFERRTLEEVGRALGLGENAARMRVERALEKLGGLLAKRGVTSTAAALSLVLAHQTVAAVPAVMVHTISTGALGQAAAASGGLTVFLQFMSTTKFTAGATGLAGLLAISATVFYNTQTAHAANELADGERTVAALRGRLQNLESQISARETAVTEAALAPRPTTSAASPPETLVVQLQRALVSDPELIRLRARESSAGMVRQLGNFYREANFSREQIAEFTEKMNRTFEQLFAAQAAGQFKGYTYSRDAAVHQELARIRAEFDRDLRASFGEAAFQRFLDYERLESAREVTGTIAATVFFTETPLGAAQSAELQRILAANSAPYVQGGSVSSHHLDWDRVLAQAAPLLSAAQFAALQAVRTRAELELKINAMTFPESTPSSP